LVDETIAARGGKRIVPLGKCDVADSNVVDQFDAWKDGQLWPALTSGGSKKPSQETHPAIDMEISMGERASVVRKEMSQATVLEAKSLTCGEPEKRHLGVHLPDGATYRAGDYLGVLPMNPATTVRRVLGRFNLPANAAIKLGSSTMSALPINVWMGAHDVLQGYVELSQPASKKVNSHQKFLWPSLY
jgi:cytochrome P450 / NADPH-cytochrome P450 reductase